MNEKLEGDKKMNEQELMEVDDKEAINFIQNKLLSEGVVVSGDDILTIVDLWHEYLESIGLIEAEEDE